MQLLVSSRSRPWIAAALALIAISSTAALAETESEERPLLDERTLSEEADRAVRDLVTALSPLIAQLSAMIDELPRYEAPVVLPNGDILIRRLPPDGQPRPNLDGSLDL